MPAILAPDIRSGFVPAARPVSRPATRFTLKGSDALEHRLANVCKKVSAGIGRIIPEHKLEGLALGGGYGRGEGGVLKTPAGDQPYNDLEFYVFVRGHPWLNERCYGESLDELITELAPGAGVELEFKISSPAQLRRSPQNLFYHDLILGHRWLRGDDRLLAGCEHQRVAENIPLSEATRLLMNRCSGLLFAREKLEHERFSAEDADFVFRNIAKTELALGDGVLIAFGKYHWSCLERVRRLSDLASTSDLPWLKEVRERHVAGVAFKLEPHRSGDSREALEEHFREVSLLALRTWLWLESRRLGCDFRSATDYAASRINKWPGSSSWRNGLCNARVFGLRALLLPRNRRHPRERIVNALTLLLWEHAGISHESTRAILRELVLAEPAGMISAYRERWRRAS
ncbi:MAG TPA: hypothetical protein VNZ64_04715 [Candidatus Acidoferrum sp.]|jgi:hypothetical protein|nr:hypothetical protein [Candidatus Acidoferrum sp.]